MTDNTTAPLYSLRGLQLIGWRDMQHALNYLFAEGHLRSGTLVCRGSLPAPCAPLAWGDARNAPPFQPYAALLVKFHFSRV